MKQKQAIITEWPLDDQPREKFLMHGPAAVSDAELLAILIRSGNRTHTAVDLSREILGKAENNLNVLGKFSYSELTKIHGLGRVKAITILAALELGRRRKLIDTPDKPRITSSKDAVDILQPVLSDLNHEEFHVLLMNQAHKVIGHRKISMGGISGTVADPRLIFGFALELKASAIILSHNHPSGNLKPSEQDIQLTKKLSAAGKSLDISVLDHIIIAGTSFYSFADEGLL